MLNKYFSAFCFAFFFFVSLVQANGGEENHFYMQKQDSRIEIAHLGAESNVQRKEFFYTLSSLPEAKIFSGGEASLSATLCRMPETKKSIWNNTDISGINLTSDEDINRWITHDYQNIFRTTATQEVYLLQQKNIINTPFENAKSEINRAEFLKIVLSVKEKKENFEIDKNQYKNCFNDVAEEWFAPYVCYAKEKEYVNGYETEKGAVFKADQKINYAEAIKIIYAVFNDPGKENPNSDDWWAAYDEDFTEEVEFLYHKGAHVLMREEMVRIIVYYLQVKHKDVLLLNFEEKKMVDLRNKIKENASLKSSIKESDCTEKKTYVFDFSEENTEFQSIALSEKIKEFSQPFGVFSLYLNDDNDLNSTARYFGVMNVGILQKKSENTQFFLAFDIETGNPISGLEILGKNINVRRQVVGQEGAKSDYFPNIKENSDFRTKKNVMQHLQSDNAIVLGKTNADGILQIERAAEYKNRKNFFIAHNANYWGVHYTSWENSMNTKKFPNAWSWWENNQVVGIIYTDRKIFRPSHTIHFKGFLRELDARDKLGLSQLPASTAITVELRKKYVRGDVIKTQNVLISKNSSFDGSFEIPKDIALGDYYITLVLPKQYNFNEYRLAAPIKIEEYKRPTFFVDAYAEKHEYFAGETAKINISSARYFGAKLSDAVGKYKVYSTPYYPTDSEDSDYIVINRRCEYYCSYDLHEIDSGDVYLDENGMGEIEVPIFSENENEIQDQTIIVEITMKDDKQEEVVEKVSFQAFLDSDENSVRPALKTEGYFMEKGVESRIEVKSKNYKLQTVTNKDITISIVYENVECDTVNDFTRGERKECTTSEEEVFSEILHTNAQGYAKTSYSFPERGQYIITAKGTGEHSVIKNIWSYAPYREFGTDIDENTDHNLSLSLNKDTYTVGEKAKLLIQSPFPSAKAFISFESDSVFSSEMVDVVGNSYIYEFVVTEDMQPNINIGAFLIEKIKDKKIGKNSIPRFKLGYENLHISLKDKKMNVLISTHKEKYEINEKISLSISVKDFQKNGISAEVSVAVVDESLVRMAGQVDTHVLPSFFPRRYLTLKNSTNLLAFLHDNYFSSFGGAGKGGRGNGILPIREDFKEVLYWNPSVQVPANGKIDISFDSGEMTTSYVVLVSGVSTNGKNQAGFSDTTFTVTKDFSLQPDVPRFVRKGDVLEMPFVIFNNLPVEQKITADFTMVNDAKNSNSFEISIPARTSKRISFPIKIPESTNEKSLTFIASIKGVSGKSDAIKMTLPILENQTMTSAYQNYQINSSKTLSLPNFVTSGNSTLESIKLVITNSSLLDLQERLSKLIQYPYGCAEQTISSTVPNAIVAQIQKTLGKDFSEAKKNTLAGLKKLENFQQTDGGFSLWEDGEKSDIWVSLIVGNGVAEMEEAGYYFSKKAKNNMVSYFEKIVSGQSKDSTERLSQIRSLSVLSSLDASKADKYLDSFYEKWENLSGIEKVELAYAFAKTSEKIPERYNKELFEKFEKEISEFDTFAKATEDFSNNSTEYYTFKHLKNSYPAYFFMVRLSLNKNFEGQSEMIQSVLNSNDENAHYFSSLQEARKFLAAYKYSEIQKEGFMGTASFEIGGTVKKVHFTKVNEAKEIIFTKNELDVFAIESGIKIILPENSNLSFSSNIILKKPLEDLFQQESDFSIERQFEKFNEEFESWESFDPEFESMKIGEKYKIVLSHYNGTNIEDAVISSYHPAGIEILTSYTESEYNYDYKNIERRDDRVDLFPDSWKNTVHYEYEIRPVAAGTYSFPPVIVLGMYDPEWFSSTSGFELVVEE